MGRSERVMGEERSRDVEEIDAIGYGNRMVEIMHVCQMILSQSEVMSTALNLF
uniref:Uncharacterized protein n=1 Tax=Oryza sativa subsp. japonica TaxID=39947 RepID=Q6YX87_ORYSJ|nr:hypothetical protein [Oryza sativa Japonica Group]